MTEKEAKKLKIGDKVYWKARANDYGHIISKTDSALEIEWEYGPLVWVDFKDFESITKEPI